MLFIMADLEEKVIKPLIDDSTIKFSTRYVGDTLLFVIKHEDVCSIQSLVNSFDPNLCLTESCR